MSGNKNPYQYQDEAYALISNITTLHATQSMNSDFAKEIADSIAKTVEAIGKPNYTSIPNQVQVPYLTDSVVAALKAHPTTVTFFPFPPRHSLLSGRAAFDLLKLHEVEEAQREYAPGSSRDFKFLWLPEGSKQVKQYFMPDSQDFQLGSEPSPADTGFDLRGVLTDRLVKAQLLASLMNEELYQSEPKAGKPRTPKIKYVTYKGENYFGARVHDQLSKTVIAAKYGFHDLDRLADGSNGQHYVLIPETEVDRLLGIGKAQEKGAAR